MNATMTKDLDIADDWIERALRTDGVEHRSTYIADDGFAGRVMARLPLPATLPAWRRPAIAVLWLCAAAVVALGLPGLFDDALRGGVTMLVGHRIGVADLVALLVIPSAAMWGILVYAARVD
jgi:hypothetical protein